MYRLQPIVGEDRMLVITQRAQEHHLRRQLREIGMNNVALLGEPESRNTAPAIALAAWYMEGRNGPGTTMAVLPSDHLIPCRETLGELLSQGEKAAERYGLVTFGVKPTYPETGYGYICQGESLGGSVFRIEEFREKPSVELASQYALDPRFFWNSGMFVFQVGVLTAEFRRYLPGIAQAMDSLDLDGLTNLDDVYARLESVSIDYGLMEKSSRATLIPASSLEWTDLGSWDAVYRFLPRDGQGNHLRGRVIALDTNNCLILAQERLIASVGIEDLAVVDGGDALLVCARKKSQNVRGIVDELRRDRALEYRQHLTEHRPWGCYTVLQRKQTYQVKRITINPGHRLSLQSHRFRAENWVVVEGRGKLTLDGKERLLVEGEHVYIPTEARHRLENVGYGVLELIEVQVGPYLGEDDIERYDDDYGREREFLRSEVTT
jgi:mannose-1-phosphate guanylyltransferase/mannose-6-phosphate isomerase